MQSVNLNDGILRFFSFKSLSRIVMTYLGRTCLRHHSILFVTLSSYRQEWQVITIYIVWFPLEKFPWNAKFFSDIRSLYVRTNIKNSELFRDQRENNTCNYPKNGYTICNYSVSAKLIPLIQETKKFFQQIIFCSCCEIRRVNFPTVSLLAEEILTHILNTQSPRTWRSIFCEVIVCRIFIVKRFKRNSV